MSDNSEEVNSAEASYTLPEVSESRIGDRRTFAGLSKLEWIFLTVSTINLATTIGITIGRMIDYARYPQVDFTFALLLFINSLFCLFFVYNGVLRELTFEVITFMAGVVIVLLYCVLEYIINIKGRTNIKLIRLIMSCVLAPLNLYLASKVAWQFGWLEFRIVGASETLQYMFRLQKAFFSLQKFDFQAAVSFAILCLKNGIHILPKEAYLAASGLVVSIIWLIMGVVAVSKEWKWLTYLFAALGIFEPAFIFAKIIKLYLNYSKEKVEDIILYPLLAVGALAIIIRVVLIGELYLVYKNFNNGLSDAAFRQLVASELSALLPGRNRRHHVCCCNVT